MEKLELKGYWWIPKKRSQKLAGDLTYSPDEGAFLTLLGTFGKRFTNNPDVLKIILGTAQDGKAFTLYNIIPAQISWGITGLGGSKYFAHLVFEGVHFTNSKEIKFHELRGMYDNLDAWIDTFGFKLDHGLSGKGSARAPSIKYSLPKNRLVELPRKRMVGVTFERTGPAWNIVQTEAKITQETFLVTKNIRGDISFFDLNEKLSRLADLFQFASQQLASPRNIVGFTKKNKQFIGEKKIPYYPPVKIYYQPIEVQKSPKKKTQHDMLFRFNELSNRQISKWFSSYEKHQTQIYLYRSLIYNDKHFSQGKELHCAILLLKYLFEAYLLQLMGIGPKRIEKIYEKRINVYKSWGVTF